MVSKQTTQTKGDTMEKLLKLFKSMKVRLYEMEFEYDGPISDYQQGKIIGYQEAYLSVLRLIYEEIERS